MSGVIWPDVVIALVLVIGAYKGFRRGFVSELAGAVAVAAALIAPWYYNGAFDGWLQSALHVGAGSAHVVGMFATGFLTYAIVIAASWVLNRFARLPFVSIGNALAGCAVGAAKAAVFVWLMLFVALYFPLSTDIRDDLHRSAFARYFMGPDPAIDRAILGTVPWFARPLLTPFVRRHHL